MIIVIESRLPLQYSVKYQKRTRKTNKKQGFSPVFKISDKSTPLIKKKILTLLCSNVMLLITNTGVL